MQPTFQNILLISRKHDPLLRAVVCEVLHILSQVDCHVTLETATARALDLTHRDGITLGDAHDAHDLMMVVGGDGSILQAAPLAIAHQMAVLGINQGRLGFLTDINTKQLSELPALLHGEHMEEPRMLLHMSLLDPQGKCLSEHNALNEVVLLPGMQTRMIEFGLHIDGSHVCHQRSDGIIAATPTGSTAHAMSAGGPIVHPALDAITLVPLCPHKLTSRPIVVPAVQSISWHIDEENSHTPNISCDGGEAIAAPLGSVVRITATHERLRLIHPTGHNHYHTLQQKLGWEKENT